MIVVWFHYGPILKTCISINFVWSISVHIVTIKFTLGFYFNNLNSVDTYAFVWKKKCNWKMENSNTRIFLKISQKKKETQDPYNELFSNVNYSVLLLIPMMIFLARMHAFLKIDFNTVQIILKKYISGKEKTYQEKVNKIWGKEWKGENIYWKRE